MAKRFGGKDRGGNSGVSKVVTIGIGARKEGKKSAVENI